MSIDFVTDVETGRVFLTNASSSQFAYKRIPVWVGTSIVGMVKTAPGKPAEFIPDGLAKTSGESFALEGVTNELGKIASVNLTWV